MTAPLRPLRLPLAAIGALAAVGLLSACTTTTLDPETAAPTASGDAATPTETPDAGPDPATCLIGAWEISEEQLNSFYDAVEGTTGDDLSITATGSTGLDFAATSYTYTPDIGIAISVAGVSGEGQLSGSIAGDYTVADGVITTSHDEASLTFPVTVNGIEMDGAGLAEGILDEHPINDAPYTCEADGTVVIQFSTGSGRTPVVLTPAG